MTKTLSPQQTLVLSRIANGQTIKQIALDLGLSVKTVEYHIAVIHEKLNLWCVADLTHYAIARKLVPLKFTDHATVNNNNSSSKTKNALSQNETVPKARSYSHIVRRCLADRLAGRECAVNA